MIVRSPVIGALLLLTAMGMARADPGTFDYSTQFLPSTLAAGSGSILTANSSGGGLTATTDITLTALTETPVSAAATLSDPFSIDLTLTPTDPAAAPITETLTGTIMGSVAPGSSLTSATFDVPSLTYDFGSAGIYTVNDFTFDRPAPNGVTDSGAISATVQYTAAPAVPEAGASSLLAFGGIGLLGLAVRVRRTRRDAI